MEEIISDAGFRSKFEFYDAEERKFKELAEEARRKKQETLIKWKAHIRETSNKDSTD